MTQRKKRRDGPPPAPQATKRQPVRKGVRAPGPLITVVFKSIEVRHNGWPGEDAQETDLSLILQLENPAGPEETRVLSSDRLPLKARSGQTVTAGDLSPGSNGVPFFKGPVSVSDHVNLHVRFFIERTSAVGPILGAALNTVIGELGRRIPLLPAPIKDAIHVQIGKTIATEIGRATVIVPIAGPSEGTHPVATELVSPRTIPGVYTPKHSPEPFKKGVVSREGEVAALLSLEVEVKLKPEAPRK